MIQATPNGIFATIMARLRPNGSYQMKQLSKISMVTSMWISLMSVDSPVISADTKQPIGSNTNAMLPIQSNYEVSIFKEKFI